MRKFIAILFTGAALAASLAGPALAEKAPPAKAGSCGHNDSFRNGISDSGSGFNSQDCAGGTSTGTPH